MFEQRFESDWRSIDDRYDQVQALRDLDELLARRSQLNDDRHVLAPLTLLDSRLENCGTLRGSDPREPSRPFRKNRRWSDPSPA